MGLGAVWNDDPAPPHGTVPLGRAAGLVAAGGKAIRRKARIHAGPSTALWPDAAVVVPASGAAPELSEVVSSLLCAQDYPSFRLVFVTRDMEDPASPVIAEAVGAHPGTLHVLSGKASGCGQKNHNLLRGVAALAAPAPDPGLL